MADSTQSLIQQWKQRSAALRRKEARNDWYDSASAGAAADVLDDAIEEFEAERSRLHQAIMNIPCDPSQFLSIGSINDAFRYGHRDARYTAAELVLSG